MRELLQTEIETRAHATGPTGALLACRCRWVRSNFLLRKCFAAKGKLDCRLAARSLLQAGGVTLNRTSLWQCTAGRACKSFRLARSSNFAIRLWHGTATRACDSKLLCSVQPPSSRLQKFSRACHCNHRRSPSHIGP